MTTTVESQQSMYRLIVSQLKADGYDEAAKVVGNAALGGIACMPSHRLAHIAKLGAQSDDRQKALSALSTSGGTQTADQDQSSVAPSGDSANVAAVERLDFDTADPAQPLASALVPQERYKSNHRGMMRAICFSADGNYVAAACSAMLTKVYSVNAALNTNDTSGNDASAVIARIADHDKAITDISFHPMAGHLISCSEDKTIRIYNTAHNMQASSSSSCALGKIQESHPVNAIAVHPSGVFLAVGTNHPILRLYDINTKQCFATQNPFDHHTGSISQLRYSSDGRQFASGCLGGVVKLWDGVSCRCVATYERAHGGASISSIQYSKNDKYLLTSGRNNECRLWDVRMGRVLNIYEGASTENRRGQCCFSNDEQRVYAIDDSSKKISVWDSATAVQLQKNIGEMNIGGCIGHSPVSNLLVTGGDNKMLRFWAMEPKGPSTEGAGEALENDNTDVNDGASLNSSSATVSMEDQCKQFLAATEPVAKRAKIEDTSGTSDSSTFHESATPPGTPPPANIINPQP